MSKYGIFRVLLDKALLPFIEVISGFLSPPGGEYAILVVQLAYGGCGFILKGVASCGTLIVKAVSQLVTNYYPKGSIIKVPKTKLYSNDYSCVLITIIVQPKLCTVG